MKATISLFLKKGFKKNLLDISIRFFLLLGGTFTVYQVLETFINVNINGLWFLILLLALSLIAIIAVFIETRILLKKTFYLKDHYKITVDVDDYIDNAKKYPEAHLISGSNNEFNINFAKEGTLQRELVDEFIGHENQAGQQSNVIHENLNGTYLDEDHDERLYNYAELVDSIDYKIENYKVYDLKPLGENAKSKRYFAYGSILSEKFKNRWGKSWSHNKNKNVNETRRMLFFANSQYSGGEYKGGKQTLNSIRLIWDHFYENNIQVNALLMPLLGTGLSNDASPMSATIAIIDHFFNISYPTGDDLLKYSQVVPHLIISIRPENIVNGEIDLEAIHKHIEVMNNRLDYAFHKKSIYYKMIDSG